MSWSSSGNVRSIRHNTALSLCPGAIINGKPEPYSVGAGEVTSPLCSSLTLSIACPIVFHSALHTGSNFAMDSGLHTFPKSVLQQLETTNDASRPERAPSDPQPRLS